MKPWEGRFRAISLVWCLVPLLKKAYLDELLPPADALYHETIAREVADLFRQFHFGEAFTYFEIGNQAYRFLLGVFYAVTSAPEVITYTVNGTLGFTAMLALLEVMCIHTSCKRLTSTTALLCMLLPSGLLWTPSNLKEGPILWGICMMFYWTCPQQLLGSRRRRGFPLLGAVVLLLLRPHIAVLWMATISVFVLLRSKKIALVVVTGAGAIVSVFLVKAVVPELFDAALHEGLTSTMNSRYENLTDNDELVSRSFINAKPIPIVTGLTLIMFRPWPTEVENVGELLAGIEVWLLAAVGIGAWYRFPDKLRHLSHPNVLSLVAGMMLFGFFFDYMYNMGLVVRQRIMCFPAVLFLYFYPLLARQNARILAGANRSRRRGHIDNLSSQWRLKPLR